MLHNSDKRCIFTVLNNNKNLAKWKTQLGQSEKHYTQ